MVLMPVILMFYGVIVLMYYFDNRQHKLPRIHIKYAEDEAVLTIPAGFLKGLYVRIK